MLGWYFAEERRRLRYGDKRSILVGMNHSVSVKPILCEQGLHASPTVLKALQYAPGPILYRVELMGEIVHSDDKSCATTRRYWKELDATPVLREFARKCALSVIHLWDAPRVVREYLETGDEDLREAARAAAGDAAGDAAWAAARAAWAAWAAAGDAAGDAAWAATRAAWAARAVAWAAAGEAAWAAAQEKLLEEMVRKAMSLSEGE